MICIPIIAGEGGSDNAKKLEKGLAGLSRRGPCGPMRGAGAPLHSPICRRSALHPGDFLPDEKVTKESPRGGHPLWVLPLGGIIIPPTARRCAALPLPPERAATPGSTQATKQLPRHGLTAEGVTLGIAWGEKKTDLPTRSKWQIGLFLLLKAARVQASAQHQ